MPGLAEARSELLPLASAFAALPDSAKVKYEVPSAYYAVGWSHGREKLQGRPDYAKGSFYANPLDNAPFSDPKHIEQYPAFAARMDPMGNVENGTFHFGHNLFWLLMVLHHRSQDILLNPSAHPATRVENAQTLHSLFNADAVADTSPRRAG